MDSSDQGPPLRLTRSLTASAYTHGAQAAAAVRAAAARGDVNGTAVSDDLVDATITAPGAVKINVTGAFIVDESEGGTSSPPALDEEGMVVGSAGGDIRLPHHTARVSHVAVDIGGSLAKLVYFTSEGSGDSGGRLNFLRFETDRIEYCLQYISELKRKQQEAATAGLIGGKRNGKASAVPELCVMATGGGAYKYYDRMKEVLGGEIIREDEMECLIIGLDFFITEIPREVFTHSEADPMRFQAARADIYPYLLVNIGSGVSMIKVSGPRVYERIGGTSLGGGTLWGLLSLLTGARTFDEMLELAEQGDNSRVDMLVGDIYGTDYSKIGLKSSLIASSFGKVFRMKRRAERDAEDGVGLAMGESQGREDGEGPRFAPEDISRSLLYAVSNNIGQIAYLQSEKHNLQRIYFGGSFIRGYRQTMNTLSYAIRFWSKGEKEAYFLRHEGYLGAVGAFLKRQPRNWGRRNSFENTVKDRVQRYV